MELERIDCQWRTIERKRERNETAFERDRAVWGSTRDLFVRPFFALWRWYHLTMGQAVCFSDLYAASPARINGPTQSIAGAGRPRENPRFAIVQSLISVSRDVCPVNWTVRYIKCAWTVVDMINSDWRSNLDIKSLATDIANDEWEKRDKILYLTLTGTVMILIYNMQSFLRKIRKRCINNVIFYKKSMQSLFRALKML